MIPYLSNEQWKEQWKDIEGYEKIYQASNLGQIRTHPNKTSFTERHGARHWQCRIMKGRGDNLKTGKRVGLWKDGQHRDWLVARLIALTWIDGYSEGMTVNHINGNRMDNRIENLEWLSLADNIRHGFRTGLYPQKHVLLDFGSYQLRFQSQSKASQYLGYCDGYISSLVLRGKNTCCNGKCKIMIF